MIFASDNWAGAHPAIGEALMRHAEGHHAAYGTGELDKAVEARMAEVFEHEVSIFHVATGTAANALALAAMARPGGVLLCHEEAHLVEDECGAPEFLSGGARLHGVAGPDGMMPLDALEEAIGRFVPGSVHTGRAVGISITQATEIGTVHGLDAIERYGELARRNGLRLHMDGARFANALVSLETTPAEMTWRRGVDFVSFGGTKNGCWCAETLIVFDRSLAEDLPYLRKRSAQLFSKSRFVSAQFDAYLKDDLWLSTARHANAMAARLATGFEAAAGVRLAWKPQANEVFAVLDRALAERLRQAGAAFHEWPVPRSATLRLATGQSLFRFVTSFATQPSDVDALLSAMRGEIAEAK